MGKGYLEIEIDRERAARFGVTVEDAQLAIETAIGGREVTQTVEKREAVSRANSLFPRGKGR